MGKSDQERVAWLDIAKGIGIIVIVLGHVLQGRGALRQFTYAFSVPLFFILTGCTYNYKENRAKFYIDKIKRILIPYYIFGLVSIVVFYFLGNMASVVSADYATTDIIPNLFGMLYGNTRTGYMKWNSPLWFLPCLFAVYCLTENFEHWVIRKVQHKIVLRASGIVASFVVSYVLVTFFEDLKLPFQFETAIMMFGYAQIGIVARNVISTEGKIINKIIKILSLLVVGMAISKYNGFTDVATYIFGRSVVLYLISSITLSFAIINIAIAMKRNCILQYLGEHTLPILLMHKFPVLFFQVMIPFTKEYLVVNGGGYRGDIVGLCVTSIVIIMCLLVYRILKRFLPWAFGEF